MSHKDVASIAASDNSWPKPNGILQMLWREMRIAHGHDHSGMSENFLQGQDIPAVLHKVTGEGMPQHVCGLPFR